MEWETDWLKWREMYCPPPPTSYSSLQSPPTTLPLVRQLLSPQNPPALFPDEAPIRPMKPDPGLLMEPVKYHRSKNPCVINIPGSPASIQIIPFRNTWVQYTQYHIDVHHRLRPYGCASWLTLIRLLMMRMDLWKIYKRKVAFWSKVLLLAGTGFSCCFSEKHLVPVQLVCEIYCYNLLLMSLLPWEVFPNGRSLLRVEPYWV